jgi:hypothetical protein
LFDISACFLVARAYGVLLRFLTQIHPRIQNNQTRFQKRKNEKKKKIFCDEFIKKSCDFFKLRSFHNSNELNATRFNEKFGEKGATM